MNKFILLTIAFINIPFSPVQATENNSQDTDSKSYSLYLIRHAEKQLNIDDPALTRCGKFRAKQIASMLENANIRKIYSTSYKRTMATAAPLAQQQKLAVKNYAPNKLEQFAWQLTKEKQNTVIFGHSNTTPQLAALLSQTKVKPISEKQYRGIYQVVISGKDRHLTLLMQPLVCQ
jgi:2,3-bisphosphoglycerate-dependent phosphoglycerate mutase